MENITFVLDWMCDCWQDGLSTKVSLFQSVPIFIPKSFLSLLIPLLCHLFGDIRYIEFQKVIFKNQENVEAWVCCVFLHYYWAANVRIMVYWQYGY